MERGPGEENGEEFTLEADPRGWVGSEPEFIDGLEDVEASEEIAYYVCEILPDVMYTEIDVRS